MGDFLFISSNFFIASSIELLPIGIVPEDERLLTGGTGDTFRTKIGETGLTFDRDKFILFIDFSKSSIDEVREGIDFSFLGERGERGDLEEDELFFLGSVFALFGTFGLISVVRTEGQIEKYF
jgi:hypothetical protein